MAAHHLAKGLASLGRHGDSMLMHVSPQEVAGLKTLGHLTGRTLSTNPHTGLPEAFDFGDFFTSLLPTIAGIALAPGTGGASLGLTGMAAQAAPVMAGMATGAAVAGAKGEDVLTGGLMGGLGGYGGGGIGDVFSKMGGALPASAGVDVTKAAPVGVNQFASGPGIQLGNDTSMLLDNSAKLASDPYSTSLTSLNNMTAMPTNLVGGPQAATGSLDTLTKGVTNFAKDPIGQWDAFKAAGGSGTQLGLPLGLAALEASAPDTSMSDEEKKRHEALANKYKSSDPNYTLNLAADSGLNLYATGGTVGVNQSTISSGGLQDLYGANDNANSATNVQLSQDGYGIGRLDNLAKQQSMNQAQHMGYAAGGPVSFASGGLFKDAINDSIKNKMPNSGGLFKDAVSDYFTNAEPNGGLFRDAILEYYKSLSENTKYAKGGYLDGQGDGMSDSIPATIEGKQPARLADGEFVVPADVVSHIGNGSTKAGATRLYSMLDKVRKARTGSTKQGRQINPNKYLPA